MPTYARYDPNTEEFSVQNMAPNGSDAHCTFWEVEETTDPNSLYIVEGELMVRPPAPGEGYYFSEAQGEWLLYPPKPNEYCVFDAVTGVWTDPRDPAQIAVDLDQARYQTNTDKRLVFYRLAAVGAYPVSELVDDTTYFPATVEQYLNSLAPAEHDTVKAALKYEPLIWRLHPHLIGDVGIQGFIPWLAAENAVTITEAQLDTIFDVPVPPPLYTP